MPKLKYNLAYKRARPTLQMYKVHKDPDKS